jgi:hypothetical protein
MSGPKYLARLHQWLKSRATNWSDLGWSSPKEVEFKNAVTLSDLEGLANDVKDAVLDEVETALPGLCGLFKPDDDDQMRCKNCGYYRNIHALLGRIK